MAPENETQPPAPFALVVLGFAAFLAVGVPAQSLHPVWGLWFGEAFIFVGLPFVGLALSGHRPARFTGLDGFTWPTALFGLGIGALTYVAWAVPLMAVAQHFFPPEVVQLFDGSAIFRNRRPVELALLVTGVIVAAPFGEEFFFRGVLQRALLTRMEGPRAVVITALIFSAFHFDPVGLLARFALGVSFGLLAWRTGSIWAGVFAHAANNAISSLAFFGAQETTEADLPLGIAAAMVLVGNGLLLGAILLARRFPRLVAARTPVEEGNAVRSHSTWAVLRPWLVALLVSFVTLLAVDGREVQLNLHDAANPLPRARRTQPTPTWRAELDALRERARHDDDALAAYLQQRRLRSAAQAEHP